MSLMMRILSLLISLLLSACSTMHSKSVDSTLTERTLPLLPQYVVSDTENANKSYAQSTMPIIAPPTWESIKHAWADQISLAPRYACIVMKGDQGIKDSVSINLELLGSQQSWVPLSGVVTTRVTLAFAPDH